MRRVEIAAFGAFVVAVGATWWITGTTPAPPPGVASWTVASTSDGLAQPVRGLAPRRPGAPLVVILHTWSGDHTQKLGADEMFGLAAARGWGAIQPEFRGPNKRPEACASALARQDVLDAVADACHRFASDEERIFLFGISGGAHMALVMAAHAPGLWAGVSAWVPITDLARWHASCSADDRHHYERDLEAVCGGPPGTPGADSEYRGRSPLFVLDRAAGVAVDLNAGVRDGHDGSVPIDHSLRAFNALAQAYGREDVSFSEEDIARLVAKPEVPEDLAHADRARRTRQEGRSLPILLRREAGSARITLFEGGHEGEPRAAFRWFRSLPARGAGR